MDPILIDLNDYVRTGEGANGASYDHKTDKRIMMKLYLRNFESARTELEMARKVYALGIPSPEPGDLVTDGPLFVARPYASAHIHATRPWRQESSSLRLNAP